MNELLNFFIQPSPSTSEEDYFKSLEGPRFKEVIQSITSEGEVAIRQKKEQEKKEEKTRLVRRKYLAFSKGTSDREENNRVAQLMQSKEFRVTFTSQGEIDSIDWDSKAQDYKAFQWLINSLRSTVTIGDEQFRKIVPEIARYLGGDGKTEGISPLYSRLNDDHIKRSAAHIHNPHQHIQDVVQMMITDGLDPWKVFRARITGFTHDIGKGVIADGDVTQIHAESSYLPLLQFFMEHPIPELQYSNLGVRRKMIDLFLLPIRNHHIFEAINGGAVSESEALDIFMHQPFTEEELHIIDAEREINPELVIIDPKESVFMTGLLSSLDAGSVDHYLPFAIVHAASFLDLFTQLQEIDWSQYDKEFFRKFCELIRTLHLAVCSPSPYVFLTTLREPFPRDLVAFIDQEDQITKSTSWKSNYSNSVRTVNQLEQHILKKINEVPSANVYT